jgi:glycosyltransferase involved in cell wall biosynthesis
MQEPIIRDYVRYLGYVANEDLPALYQAAVSFVSPSIYEGFGLPYLEAMAAGAPVIASKVPTVTEICGDAALYVDPFSGESIAAGFATLWRDHSQRDQLRKKGFERATRFTWAHAAKEIMGILESLAVVQAGS